MFGCTDRWLQLPGIAKLFGLSEDSIKRLAKNHALPLRRVTPLAIPGVLETELIEWVKTLIGPPIRNKRPLTSLNYPSTLCVGQRGQFTQST
jgi:hypothetical protein